MRFSQLPEEGQKWGFLIWLVFSYCGLVCLACITAGKVSTSEEIRFTRFIILNIIIVAI